MNQSKGLGVVEIHKGRLTEQASLLVDPNHLMSIQHSFCKKIPMIPLHISANR